MATPSSQPQTDSNTPLRDALNAQRPALRQALALSTVIGALLLVPSWYMFEVYGRVLNSRNTTTLWWLVAMVMGVYVVVELLDLVRHRVLQQAASNFERRVRTHLFEIAFSAQLKRQPGGTVQPFNDLKALRDFGSSPVVTSFMDIPTAMLSLALLFAIGPWLGAVALAGALALVWLIWLTERRTMPLLTQAISSSIQAQGYAANTLRNAQVIESLGMMGRIHARWHKKQRAFLMRQAEASDYAGVTSAVAKLLQSMQGSILLGAGSWIALHGGLWGGVGMVIIASIFGGRALQPLAQLVQSWRVLIQARDAHDRLKALFALHQSKPRSMPLPPPVGHLTVEAAVAAAPGQTQPILRSVSFEARPGQMTLIIGPTASGKSTLARLLVGVWPCMGGTVRLDGADLHAWNKEELGPHLGYLPQSVELFDGTVAENIARFGAVDMDRVREAVDLVGMQDVIDALPEGYDTRIGDDGAVLSGGQRQRLGLARAVYGKPRLLVLDEPNSSLDTPGEQALLAMVIRLKALQCTVLAITHRNGLMPAADRLVILREGQVAAAGPRDEVLDALNKANERARQAQQEAAARAAAVKTGTVTRPLTLRPEGAK
jgi:ATP-binding cassette, subfamily C, bacterial exporter for protease/lipase